jgi:uncharacterized integral membrane protein
MNDEVSEHAGAVHRRDAGRVLRLVLIAVVAVAIIVVALDNRDKVRVGYAFGSTQAPIWIVIVAAALGGMLIGWLIRHRPHRNV